jgi:hypothetical protein
MRRFTVILEKEKDEDGQLHQYLKNAGGLQEVKKQWP